MPRRAALLLLVGAVACGGRTPTAPSPPAPPRTITLTGHVTDTVTGRPVSATVVIDGIGTVQSDGSGTFTATTTAPTSSSHVSVSAPGYLSRDTQLGWSGAATADLIPDAAPFSLTFYRQFVRHTFDHPEKMEPLRRWTHPPRIY